MIAHWDQMRMCVRPGASIPNLNASVNLSALMEVMFVMACLTAVITQMRRTVNVKQARTW